MYRRFPEVAVRLGDGQALGIVQGGLGSAVDAVLPVVTGARVARGQRLFEAQGKQESLCHSDFASSLAVAFVQDNGGGRGGIEGLNARGHGNMNSRIGRVHHILRQPCAFIAD